MEWLGISDQEMTRLVREKTLVPRYFRKGARAHFVKAEVRELLQPIKKVA